MAQQQSTSPAGRDRRPPAGHRRLNQRTMLIGFALVCMLALAVFVIRASSRSSVASADRADITNAQLVAQGQRIYATRCASCHGSDLQGEQGWPQRRPNGMMPASPLDARSPTRQRDDQWIFTTIKQGGQATAAPGDTSAMPAFGGGLTDADIWAVISYIKSTWPNETRIEQPQL